MASPPEPASGAPDPFSTDHLLSRIGSHVMVGLFVTYGTQSLRILITLAGMAVLARLLLPADFGLFALATAFTGMATIIVDLGFSTATSQRKEINQNAVSALFMLNIAAAIVIAAALALISPLIAYIFRKPDLAPLLAAMSGVLIITAAAAQHRALLLRQMRFPLLGAIDVVTLLAGTAAGIAVAATTDLGAWCLVVTQLVTGLGNSIAFWLYSRWWPSRRVAWRAARAEMVFGARVTVSTLVLYFGRQTDSLLLGFFRSAAELGQYSRALGIILLPVNLAGGPLTAVITPALARVQDDPVRWRKLFLFYLGVLAFVAMPISAILYVFAHEVVAIVLGPNWHLAPHLVQLMALGMMVEPLISASAWIHYSLGHIKSFMRVVMVSTAALVIGFLIGVRIGDGAIGVATAYSTVMLAAIVPRVFIATRGAPVSTRDFFREIAPQAIGAACGGAAYMLVERTGVLDLNLIPRVVLGMIPFGIGYLSGFLLAGAVIPGEFRLAKIRAMLASRQLSWRTSAA